MEKEELIKQIKQFIETNETCKEFRKIQDDNKYRVEITINPEETIDFKNINITPRQGIRAKGIRLTFEDGRSRDFTNGTLEALLFVVEKIGYEKCHNLYPGVVMNQQPSDKDKVVEKIDCNSRVWYVLKNAGTEARVRTLNGIFKKSHLNWSADVIC